MKHVNLSDSLGTLAGAIQSGQQTNTTPAGSISVPNADGTKTILGKAAGAAGVAPWVGDTTAPGVPTGISASSTSGIVTVTWDGTLDGGVPEDFAYVTILIDGVERGRLTHAGALPVDGLTVGAEVQVTATASDAARLEDGTLSPNVSAETEPVTVTVASVVSQDELDAVTATAAAAKTAGDQAVQDAATAAQTASSALTVATGKITTGTGTPGTSNHATGDLYLQTDSSGHVINILVFNASNTWVPYILVASALLVASSVGTTQIADGAITTAKLVAACVTAAQIAAGAITTDKLAANSVTAANIQASEALMEKLLVRLIKADELDVGSVAAAIVTSTEFHTADGRLGFDSTNGFYAKDANGNYVFKVDPDGSGVLMVGGLKTALTGNRVEVTSSSQNINGATVNVGAASIYTGQASETPAVLRNTYMDTRQSNVGDVSQVMHLDSGLVSDGHMPDDENWIELWKRWHQDGTGSITSSSGIDVVATNLKLNAQVTWVNHVPTIACASVAELTSVATPIAAFLKSPAGGSWAGTIKAHVENTDDDTETGDYLWYASGWNMYTGDVTGLFTQNADWTRNSLSARIVEGVVTLTARVTRAGSNWAANPWDSTPMVTMPSWLGPTGGDQNFGSASCNAAQPYQTGVQLNPTSICIRPYITEQFTAGVTWFACNLSWVASAFV